MAFSLVFRFGAFLVLVALIPVLNPRLSAINSFVHGFTD
jgi:hypothetical protein